jgi:hypothetical protein
MSGIVGALIAVLGLIAFVWGLTWFQHSGTPNPTPTIKYGAALAGARSEAPFHVLAPAPLPAGLRATSVGWDGVGARVSWRLGFLTPQQDFIGLYEGNGSASQFIAASTPATHPAAPVAIDGTRWLVLTDPGRGETALVHTVGAVTVVVTGTADQRELVTFARSLH